jgi:hypothetical protein
MAPTVELSNHQEQRGLRAKYLPAKWVTAASPTGGAVVQWPFSPSGLGCTAIEGSVVEWTLRMLGIKSVKNFESSLTATFSEIYFRTVEHGANCGRVRGPHRDVEAE